MQLTRIMMLSNILSLALAINHSQAYCAEHFGGNIDLVGSRMAQFFRHKVFTRTKEVRVKASSGYQGCIGITQADPMGETENEAKAEQKVLRAKFQAGKTSIECIVYQFAEEQLVHLLIYWCCCYFLL